MKKIFMLIGFSLIVNCLFSYEKPVFNREKAVVDTGKKTISDVSAIETVKNMKTGWNLGNTMDATAGNTIASETSWSQPRTTKEMFDGLKASGIKTVRIPVSWSNHIIDSNYTIDPAWMARVKEIVDWAIADDLYVILNTHHDNYEKNAPIPRGRGYYPTKENFDESSRFFVNVWSQIALAFNNGYDEHLIFETMNEPRLRGTNEEWWFDKNSAKAKEAADMVNKYNQIIVDVIRDSEGNNLKRFIACPGLMASPEYTMWDLFKIPNDKEKDKLIIAVHMYDPYNFAGESPGTKTFTKNMGSQIAVTFKKLNEKFIKKGYPVIIGEYGATNKNNLDARLEWFHFFLKYSRLYGITSCLWDNGSWLVTGNDYSEHFGYYNRKEQKWYFPEILQAIQEETK